MRQQVRKDTGKLSWELWGWRHCTRSDCKLTKGGSLPCEWKKGDWGSLIHDSNEMSQAVESQRQRIPRQSLYYSFHHKSDRSKGEGGHKWLPLVMGKLLVSRCHRSYSRTSVNYSLWMKAKLNHSRLWIEKVEHNVGGICLCFCVYVRGHQSIIHSH